MMAATSEQKRLQQVALRRAVQIIRENHPQMWAAAYRQARREQRQVAGYRQTDLEQRAEQLTPSEERG